MAKSKRPPEAVNGAYTAVPHRLLDGIAFTGASDRAKSLLFALMRQLNGGNNGRLQLTDKWLAAQGWPSVGANLKSRTELIERGLIVQTRWGGLNAGCNWYAVTWLPISNFVGLDIQASTYHQGAWGNCTLPPTARRKPPEKRETHSDHRSCTTPVIGAGAVPATPTIGAKKGNLGAFTTPTRGADGGRQGQIIAQRIPWRLSRRIAAAGGRVEGMEGADGATLTGCKWCNAESGLGVSCKMPRKQQLGYTLIFCVPRRVPKENIY